MRTSNKSPRAIRTPGRNNETRWDFMAGIFTLRFVNYKVQTAVPFDCQIASLLVLIFGCLFSVLKGV
jgi:hypothetical protein